MNSDSKYLIGIDFGTTNCTMAYALQGQPDTMQQFEIPQITHAGVQGSNPLLPSFLYFPLEEEVAAKLASVDWATDRLYCVGEFARSRGADVPSRLVSSVKSWLCHLGIDRQAVRLPIIAEEAPGLMSPVDGSAEILRHLKEVWDLKMGEGSFISQKVFITVPASFDPSARQLIMEAAAQAAYPEVVLLEEPQAAFYAWLQQQGDLWRQQLAMGDTVLVIDIGGGTTDFSLISVKNEEGDLALDRVAVGSHLLLGGDNIDYGLAYIVKAKLSDLGHELDEWQMLALVHACRECKEELLSDGSPEQVSVTVQGRGRRLIGGSLTVELKKTEVLDLIENGFLPMVQPQERSRVERQVGLQELGLPFVSDARISCQLAKFLSMTGELDSDSMENFVLPTAVLFNGGTMKSELLRKRVLELLDRWAKGLGCEPVKELPHAQYDFAVSRGAVFYGMAREGHVIRIRSGVSHSYYIGVEDAVPAVPGLPTPLRAICVVPYGMEEGSECELDTKEFILLVGRPAVFRFFKQAKTVNGKSPLLGSVVRNWKADLTELPPIETSLEGAEEDGHTFRVKMRSKVTELGVLELWCVAAGGRQWKLEFAIRGTPVMENK